MNVEKLLHDAHLRYQRQHGVSDASSKPKGSKFVEPTSDTWIRHHRTYHPVGFYRLHCSHDKPRWEPCVTCKRGQREAEANFVKLLSGQL